MALRGTRQISKALQVLNQLSFDSPGQAVVLFPQGFCPEMASEGDQLACNALDVNLIDQFRRLASEGFFIPEDRLAMNLEDPHDLFLGMTLQPLIGHTGPPVRDKNVPRVKESLLSLLQSIDKDAAPFCVDGRMSAEVLRLLTAWDPASRQHYPVTMFRTEEAFPGPCTAKTTSYCANIAPGLMIGQFTKYLMRLPIDADIQLNLLASELSVGRFFSFSPQPLFLDAVSLPHVAEALALGFLIDGCRGLKEISYGLLTHNISYDILPSHASL